MQLQSPSLFKALEQLSSITICAIAYIHTLKNQITSKRISLTELNIVILNDITFKFYFFIKLFNNSHISETMKIHYETMVNISYRYKAFFDPSLWKTNEFLFLFYFIYRVQSGFYLDKDHNFHTIINQ